MAAVSTQVLTHLDPLNGYNAFDNIFDRRVYIRFLFPGPCLTHVQIHAGSSRRQVHFFLPELGTNLLQRPIRGFNDTRIYLYCVNEDSVNLNRETFRSRALYNIFTVDRLEFHLNAAQLELLYELVLEAPGQANDRDEWATTAFQQVENLRSLYQRHIDTQLGQQPAEVIQDDTQTSVI